MSTSVGGITIEMAADIARLRKDMDDARRAVGSSMRDIQQAVDLAKKAFVAFAGVATVGAFAGMIKGAIDAQAALHDLSIQTGASVAALGQFKQVGAFTETSIDSITGAMGKLAKSMATSDEDSKGAAIALKALGVNFNDFKALAPEDQMLEVAKAMSQFKDGTDKSAAAQALFGKEGAKLLPFLADLAGSSDEVSAALTEQEKANRALQAAQSDAFGDNLTQARKNGEAWKKELAAGMTPALYEVSQAFIDVTTGAGGIAAEIKRLSKDGSLAEWTRDGVTGLSYLADGAQYVMRFIKLLAEYIGATAADAANLIGGIGDAVGKAITGDFAGASAALGQMGRNTAAINADLQASIDATWGAATFGEKLRARMADLRGVQVEAKAAGKDLNVGSALAAAAAAAAAAKDRDKQVSKDAAEAAKMLAAANGQLIKSYDDNEAAILSTMGGLAARNATLMEQAGAQRALTESERDGLKLTQDLAEGKVRLTDAEIANARALIASNAELERQIAWQKESAAQNAQSIADTDRRLAQAQQDVQQQREVNDAIGMTTLELGALKKARLEEMAVAADKRAQLLDEIDWTGQLGDQQRELAKAYRESAVEASRGATLKAAQDEMTEWRKVWDDMGKSLTDALMKGGKSAADYLKGMFRSMVLRPLLQPIVNGALGLVGLGAAGTAGAGSAGGSGGAGTLSMLSGAKSVYDMAAGGMASFGGSVSAGAYNAGSWLSNSAGMNNVGGAMMNNAGAIGGAATWAGGIGAGIGLGRAISGQYSAIGSNKNTAVVAGTAIGSIWGPIGAAIGGVVGGFVNRAFGRGAKEIKDAGIEAQASSGGVTGAQTFTDLLRKGGWFRSDKNWTENQAISSKASDTFGAAVRDVYRSVGDAAKAIGLSDKSIQGYVTSIRISLKGLDDAAKTQAFAKALGKLGEDLAATLSAQLEPLRRDGETTGTALARLSTALMSVNDVLDVLGQTALSAKLASADAAQQLTDLFGGAQQYAQAASSYLGNFYSDSERAAISTRRLSEQLGKLGLSLPATRAEYRKLVEAQDLNTASGRAAYTMLLSLSDVFAQLATVTSAASESVLEEIKRLRGAAGATGTDAELRARFATATAQARAGDQAALQALPEISKALEAAAEATSTTAADGARLRAWLAGSLTDTLKAIGVNVPAFAAGGDFGGGLRLVGERGPEIEATGPSRIWSASQTARMLSGNADGGEAVVIELRSLRAEVAGLRAESQMGAAQLASHARRTSNYLERVIDGVDAVRTTT